MKWFRRRPHIHRPDHVEQFMKASLLTGVPVTVARIETCKCGSEFRTLTPAGWQQVGWGADMDSLFGDGPIRRTPDWSPPPPIVARSADELNFMLNPPTAPDQGGRQS